jgi:hypothetical protein
MGRIPNVNQVLDGDCIHITLDIAAALSIDEVNTLPINAYSSAKAELR